MRGGFHSGRGSTYIAPPAGGGIFPNRPAGFTTQLDTDFPLLSAGNDYGVPVSTSTNASGLRLADAPDQGRLAIIDASTGVLTASDGSNPSGGTVLGTSGMSSAPYAFSGKFPVGATKGNAPWSLWPALLVPSYSKVYIAQVLMLSSNFSTLGISGFKYIWPMLDAFTGSQEDGEGNNYTGFDDSNTVGGGAHLNFGIFQQGAVDSTLLANQGGAAVTQADFMNHRGAWTQIEMLLEANTDNATANGRARVWINNVLTHDYPAMQWQGGASPRKWNHVTFEPTWGGDAGGPYPPADMYMNVDRYVIAGSN